jgi:hypothetical protein
MSSPHAMSSSSANAGATVPRAMTDAIPNAIIFLVFISVSSLSFNVARVRNPVAIGRHEQIFSSSSRLVNK